jgi:hypothetical protein
MAFIVVRSSCRLQRFLSQIPLELPAMHGATCARDGVQTDCNKVFSSRDGLGAVRVSTLNKQTTDKNWGMRL